MSIFVKSIILGRIKLLKSTHYLNNPLNKLIIKRPIFRSKPDIVVGTPVLRAILLRKPLMPSIRFQEKEKPYFLPMRFAFIKSLRVLIKNRRSGPFLARFFALEVRLADLGKFELNYEVWALKNSNARLISFAFSSASLRNSSPRCWTRSG